MVSLLQISLTARCNLACETCPMAKWRNTDDPKYRLTNARLLPWVRKYVDPSEWVIELTGGEPALYDGIDNLVTELTASGYRGLVKTNGLLPIKATDGFRRIAAFHQFDNPPTSYDEYLIVDKLQREEKEEYCKECGIPYKVIGFNKENPDNATHGFDKISFMDPHGHSTVCPADSVRWEPWPDRWALEFYPMQHSKACGHCKTAIDAWRFLPPEIKLYKENLR